MNKYNVIHINMANYLSESKNIGELISFIEEDRIDELKNENTDIQYPKRQNLIKIIASVFSQTDIPFIFIIDEWDCIFRKHKNDTEAQTKYLDFLRSLLKDQSYVCPCIYDWDFAHKKIWKAFGNQCFL